MTEPNTAQLQALDALEVRLTTARDLVRALPGASDPFDTTSLVQAAIRVYARAVVWLGEDPAVLAEDAHGIFQDEQGDAGGQTIDPVELGKGKAPDDVAEMLAYIEHHGDRPEPHDHERARMLCLNILACLMHAEYAAHGTEWEVYDAYEPLMF